MTNDSFQPRAGSALVIVLGLLAVLMLMAMAFIVAMRTERGGSANQRHATVARQMLDTAIVRALQDLDEELMGVVTNPANGSVRLQALPTAPWMVHVSTNRAGSHSQANILSHEAAQHLPPDQRLAARFANPGWMPITAGTADPADDPLVGRYAYVILNNTGYLDANLVHNTEDNTNHFEGATLGEIRVAAPSRAGQPSGQLNPFTSLADANQFGDDRRNQDGRYESMAEMLRLTKLYDGAPDENNVDTPDSARNNSLSVFSHAAVERAPIEPDSIAEGSGGTMIPYGRRKNKVLVSVERLEKDYSSLEKDVREAFAEIFKDPAAGWTKLPGNQRGTEQNGRTPGPDRDVDSGYTHIDAATAALFDYIDGDLLPGRNAKGQAYYGAADWSDRPCTEPVPMLDRFIVYQPGGGPGNHYRQTPELDPNTGAQVAMKHEFPFRFLVQTVFLNRTLPTAAENKNFRVEFEVKNVTIGPEPDGSNAFAGIDPTTRTELQASLNTWTAKLKGSFNHNPGTSDGIERIAMEDLGPDPLSIRWPVGEIPMPNEFTIYLDLEAQVELAGQVVQRVPGAGYRQNNPLRMGILFNRDDLSNDQQVDVGWAFVCDPRFAYEGTAKQALYWMTKDLAKTMRVQVGSDLEPALRDWLDAMVASELPNPSWSHYNHYTRFLLKEATARTFTGRGTPFTQGLDFTEWPDVLYSDRRGLDFLDDSDVSANSALIMVRNGEMVSVGEMGNLVVAPWRTLSLFDGVHPLDPAIVIPRHTVLDRFTVPSASSHRVNLNPPFRVTSRQVNQRTVVTSNEERNLDPLTAVFADLPLNEFGKDDLANPTTKRIPWTYAANLADILCNNVLQWDRKPNPPNDHLEWHYNTHGFAYDLSVLGRTPPDPNNPRIPSADRDGTLDRELTRSFVDDGQTAKGPRCDFEREAIIRNAAGLLTTRQQIYTLVIRADAFTPRFGFDDAGEGSTLASAHAIVEVWRDPEPLRDSNGDVETVPGDQGSPLRRQVVLVRPNQDAINMQYNLGIHRWFIRYLHQF